MINYTAGPTFITFNKQYFDKLPDNIKKAVLKAGRESMKPANDLIAKMEQDDIDFMISKGVKVVKTDLAGYKEIRKGLYDSYRAKYGDAWLKMWGAQ